MALRRSTFHAIECDCHNCTLVKQRDAINEHTALWNDEIGTPVDPVQPAPTPDEQRMAEWRCPRCGSNRWVSVSLDYAITRIPQCVPCGHYDHTIVLGPGWRANDAYA